MYQNPRFSCSSVLYPVVLKDQHLQLVKTVQWQANYYLKFLNNKGFWLASVVPWRTFNIHGNVLLDRRFFIEIKCSFDYYNVLQTKKKYIFRTAHSPKGLFCAIAVKTPFWNHDIHVTKDGTFENKGTQHFTINRNTEIQFWLISYFSDYTVSYDRCVWLKNAQIQRKLI